MKLLSFSLAGAALAAGLLAAPLASTAQTVKPAPKASWSTTPSTPA
ncbi:hypothetical protein [Polaromonas sp. Pch-P]|nr:hypothetical protein [Polaromonas sp. Pch-P]